MNANISSTIGVFAVGGLRSNADFEPYSRSAQKHPAGLSVLVATLDKRQLDGMRGQGGRGGIGFGAIAFTTTEGEIRQVMTIRCQVEGTQCYWLTDMSDAEIWTAIDAWRKRKAIPLAFVCGDQVMYSAVEYPIVYSSIDRFRSEVAPRRCANTGML